MNEQEKRIQEIRERHAKALGGPWHFWHRDMTFGAGSVDFGKFDALVVGEQQRTVGPTLRRVDADFIANAHQDIPFLLELVERMEAGLNEWESVASSPGQVEDLQRKLALAEKALERLDGLEARLRVMTDSAQNIVEILEEHG